MSARPAPAICIAIACIACLLTAAAAAASADADRWIERARQQHLAEHPGWLALLHYKPAAITRRVHSQADDDAFFLAVEGRSDAAAELRATLRAMAAPVTRDGHAQCRFPARWHWLRRQLQISDAAEADCPELAAWINAIAGDRLVLIFPTMYLNNPGSMFGHTFLRFDRADGNPLLSHALNYAAMHYEDDDMATYVLKGLAGGYQGRFALRRYFETVQEYSNLQNRDIHEYTLNLTADEIRQLLRHVWEVRAVDFDYYFLRENCSYRLLSLIETVRPGSRLTSGRRFPLYAIPVDTVRALEQAGMIREKNYRPSLYSKIERSMNELSSPARSDALRLADGRLSVDTFLSAQPQAPVEVMETAWELLEFREEQDSPQAASLLQARSRYPQQSTLPQQPPPPPETGHASARVEAGFGERNDRTYLGLGFRPGFHDLADAARGFVPGAEINVLETRVQYTRDQQLLLDQLRFFNVVSLNPVRRWYAPVSWLLDIKLERIYLEQARSTVPLIVRGGVGWSADVETATLYGMLTGDAEYDRSFESEYRVLAGLEVGIVAGAGFGQLHAVAGAAESVAGMERNRDYVDVQLQLNLETDLALRVGYQRKHDADYEDTNLYTRMQWYF